MAADVDRKPEGAQTGLKNSVKSRKGLRLPVDASTLQQNFATAVWTVLAYSCVVILFGAFVRASLSGDGCGTSWPLCGDAILPSTSDLKRLIEFTHRATSGLTLLFVAGLYVMARKRFEVGDIVRKSAGWALVFTLVSAGIGALLVIFSWVTHDRSLGRAITMPLHLINTFLLLGSLTICAYTATHREKVSLKNQGPVGTALKASLIGMFVLGASGAISAMGKTAFSTELEATQSLADRLNLHLGENAHVLLRGGISHPLLATSIAVMILMVCNFVTSRRDSREVHQWAKVTAGFILVELAFGVLNLVMSAPVWMQLVHLALALGAWISIVMLAVTAASAPAIAEPKQELSENPPTPPINEKATVKDYITLTKPRVISLLLFTTIVSMFIAQPGWPGGWLILAVAIGGYMAAGSANTFNMIVERDLDVAMERTSHRPTVTQRISNKAAFWFAMALGLGSFALLWAAANLLAASMAMAGLLFYVFIYTLLLKRRTWQNIVIGGAAGAFPPLVGYAAVSGELNTLAWFLFAIIFTWTPVHFWALAILIKDDYAKAGVPMLPVIHGDRATVIQIVLYAFVTAIISVIPLLQKQVGLFYLLGSAVLNLVLVVQSLQLLRHTDRPHAKALFKYSMVYLALFFVVIAVDRAGWS